MAYLPSAHGYVRMDGIIFKHWYDFKGTDDKHWYIFYWCSFTFDFSWHNSTLDLNKLYWCKGLHHLHTSCSH